jgi:hypothetical protein
MDNGRERFGADNFRAMCNDCYTTHNRNRVYVRCKICMIPFFLFDHLPALVSDALLSTSIVARCPTTPDVCFSCVDPEFLPMPPPPFEITPIKKPNPRPEQTTAATPIRKKLFPADEVVRKAPSSVERKTAEQVQEALEAPKCPMCYGPMQRDLPASLVREYNALKLWVDEHLSDEFSLRCSSCHYIGKAAGMACNTCGLPLSIVSFKSLPLEKVGQAVGLCVPRKQCDQTNCFLC